jgi:glycosyltransferase involved in cell wall biosynthesis
VRRLVLLTNQYPHRHGDVDFVSSEIGALASAYDEVHVFSYTRDARPELVAMPPNVTYRGNLFDAGRSQGLLGFARPSVWVRFIRMIADEVRSGRFRKRERHVWSTSIASVKRAYDPRLRASMRGADVTVYCFWGMGGGMAVPALPRPRGGIVVRLHRFDVYDEGIHLLPLRRSIYRRADLVLPVSEHARRYVLERFGDVASPAKVVVSRLGSADPGPYARAPHQGDEWLVASCSSVTPVKRVHRIFEGLQQAEGLRVRWVHFGGGPLLDELASRTETARDGLRVELRGQVDNARVIEFYRSERVDAFVNVSSSEGVPVSIMEAMSFDIPVLATAVGGSGEIVSAELGSGRTLPADFTDEAFARSLGEVLTATAAGGPRSVWERMSDARSNAQAVVELLATASARTRRGSRR